jgi:hypothetical protein
MREKLKLYKEHNIIVVYENIKLLPDEVSGISIRCFDKSVSDWEENDKKILGINCSC